MIETIFSKLKQKITPITKNEMLLAREGGGNRILSSKEANLENQLIKISNLRAKRKHLSDSFSSFSMLMKSNEFYHSTPEPYYKVLITTLAKCQLKSSQNISVNLILS